MKDPRNIFTIIWTLIRIIAVSLVIPAMLSMLAYYGMEAIGFSEITSTHTAYYIQIGGSLILFLFGIITLLYIILKNKPNSNNP